MTTVETARGPVATAEFGPTLMHEHIVTRSPGVHENCPTSSTGARSSPSVGGAPASRISRRRLTRTGGMPCRS